MESAPAKFEDSTEFANYFITYAYLYHQKQMLEDHQRMVSYRDAILGNRKSFAGAVVLDVGTGSGVLAIWAAQAGAKKVYAVEATGAAKFARAVIEHNGLSGVIEVLQQKMEDVVLPEKVDIIVSEWMGYMLLRESMLDSVLVARDRWLKPGGSLYPSKATIYLAPIRTPMLQERSQQLTQTLSEWGSFAEYMQQEHGIAVDCLNEAYADEHKNYFMRTAQWRSLSADAVVGEASAWYSFDVRTVTIDELKTAVSGPFACAIRQAGPVHALAGWFDVLFDGSPSMVAEAPVVLSTSPVVGYTHWGQQVFLLSSELFAERGDVLHGEGSLTRQENNPRTLHMHLSYQLGKGAPLPGASRERGHKIRFAID